MRRPLCRMLLGLSLLAAPFGWPRVGLAGHPQSAPVPPSLEIEVIEPGVDPHGNPAVVLTPGRPGELTVDIPPVVLVHRYYYTGDRSFQGPMLPGGPSILVVNHPKTGERCYISAQMMPGAPRVIYTASTIEYDYGAHGMTLCFGILGQPKIKYRSGLPWHEKINEVTHAEQIHDGIKQCAARATHTTVGAAVEIGETLDNTIAVPATNLLRALPFGQMLLGGDLEEHYTEVYNQNKLEFQRDHAAKQAARLGADRPTNR